MGVLAYIGTSHKPGAGGEDFLFHDRASARSSSVLIPPLRCGAPAVGRSASGTARAVRPCQTSIEFAEIRREDDGKRDRAPGPASQASAERSEGRNAGENSREEKGNGATREN